jgi:hypothetical protein
MRGSDCETLFLGRCGWGESRGVFDGINRINRIALKTSLHPVHPVNPVKKCLLLRSQGPEGRSILARPVRAGNTSASSAKPCRGGTRRRRRITRRCRPYGAFRVASRCTGADAPAYNVSPLRGWWRLAEKEVPPLRRKRDRQRDASPRFSARVRGGACPHIGGKHRRPAASSS